MATGGKQYITWKDIIILLIEKLLISNSFSFFYIEQKLKAFHLYIFFFFTIVYKSENYVAYTGRII